MTDGDDEEVTLRSPQGTTDGIHATVGQVRLGRWGKLGWFPFQTLIAYLLIQSGVTSLLDPASTDIKKAPAVAVMTVGAFYVVSGVSILLGLWRGWWRAEMAGLGALMIGFTVTLLMAIGYRSGQSFEQALLYGPLAWAAGTRALALLRGRTTIQLERVDP